MDFTDQQIERYARHIVLREVGGSGQQRLLRAKVLVIGAGGLGSPLIMYLAAAGVGTIGVVDLDFARSPICSARSCTRPRALAWPRPPAPPQPGALNPDVRRSSTPSAWSRTTRSADRAYDLVADGATIRYALSGRRRLLSGPQARGHGGDRRVLRPARHLQGARAGRPSLLSLPLPRTAARRLRRKLREAASSVRLPASWARSRRSRC